MNLTELFLHMTLLGAEWVLWVLVALSLISVAVIFERLVFYSVRRIDLERLSNDLKAALRAGNLEQALALVRDSKAVECQILAAGISQVPRGMHAVSEAMLSAKARERLRLDAYLPVLGTIGSNAPFVGLLGTVLGIVKAAHDMTQDKGHGGAASAVMGGVFEALVATAVGLCVAIPAVVAFNIFQRRVRSTIGRADSLAHLLLAQLKPEPAAGPVRPPKPPKVPDGRWSSAYADEGDEAMITDINVTPLVDVVLVLLIVFMITVPTMVALDALKERELTIQLPQASEAKPLISKPAGLRVNVKLDGTLSVLEGGKLTTVTEDELLKILQQAQVDNPGRANVNIRADKNVPTQRTVTVLNLCLKAHFRPADCPLTTE